MLPSSLWELTILKMETVLPPETRVSIVVSTGGHISEDNSNIHTLSMLLSPRYSAPSA